MYWHKYEPFQYMHICDIPAPLTSRIQAASAREDAL